MAELPVEISVTDTQELLRAGDEAVRLIDCREQDEWDICHIDGAELMPLTRFGEEADAKLQDTSQRLIIYCHHGMRSLRAASWLRQKGFTQTQSMAGGIAAWSDYVDPEMPRY
jgi:rhodanese-related sulfurtransferase